MTQVGQMRGRLKPHGSVEWLRHTAELDGVNYIDEIAAALGLRVVLEIELGSSQLGNLTFDADKNSNSKKT